MFPGETILSGAPAKHYTFEVLSSPAGWYIGTRDEMGPYSRESGYYGSAAEALRVLGEWEQISFASRDWDARVIPDPRLALIRECYEAGLLKGART